MLAGRVHAYEGWELADVVFGEQRLFGGDGFFFGALLVGLFLGLRFCYFLLTGTGQGHIQSVILAGVLLGIGFQSALIAFLADIIAVNRQLLEKILMQIKM